MSLSTSDSVVEGILEYSLKPYAKQNGIDVVNLINDLYIYHTKNHYGNERATCTDGGEISFETFMEKREGPIS